MFGYVAGLPAFLGYFAVGLGNMTHNGKYWNPRRLLEIIIGIRQRRTPPYAHQNNLTGRSDFNAACSGIWPIE